MNEEQLIEFINWLPTAVPEFQDASPEQIVQTLNQLYESEEGQATLSQLFTAFQESKQAGNSQMFKKGGKLDQLTQKAKKGKKMCCKKKEIVQGGMVNKVAEKMQNGDKMPSKSVNSILFPGMNYDYSNLTKPFDENGNIVDTTQSNNPNIFQRFKNWWQRNTQPTIITEPARSPEQIDSLLNAPRPSFFGSPRRKQTTSVLTAQDGSKLTRRQALDYGMTNQGYSRSHARTALANAMNTGRELGMRGKELRQWARRGVAAIPDAPDIDIFSDISLPEEELTVPVGRFIFTKKQQNPTVELMQNPQTFAQAFASARKEGLDEFTWRGNKYNTLTKEEAAALPMVDSRYSDALYRDFWNKKFPSNYVEKQQQGGEFDNPLVRNATLSTLGILDSTRPFVQQNVTPNETREFYAYSRDRLPDNVGGTGNFEGAIRTITPRDTTISYQLPGLAIYTAASSKDRGPRWKEMNSKMDSIKNKANNQKNK